MSDRAAAARKAGLVLVPMDQYLHQGIPGKSDAEIIAQHTGYKVLQEKLSTIPVDLMKVLKDADIPAYTWTSVTAYMKEALSQHTQEREQKRKKVEDKDARSFRLAIAAAFSTMAIVGIGGFFNQWLIVVILALCSAAIATYFMNQVGQNFERSDFVIKRWQTVELKDYGQEIPNEIASRIAKIICVLPEAEFKVLELTNDPDPFLIVSYKGSDIVIGVWDEPSYEAEIIA